MNDDVLVIAISDPLDFDTLDNLRFLLKREMEMVCSTPGPDQAGAHQILRQRRRGRRRVARRSHRYGRGVDRRRPGCPTPRTRATQADSAIIKLVSLLLLEAYKTRASDIHLEPLEKRFRVRFRIDGVLAGDAEPAQESCKAAIVSRLKIMSGTMSIAEKRLPQDGRIQVKMGQKVHRFARLDDPDQPR